MEHKGIVPIHLAAQYLAAAGISFVDAKDDDSHTNLGYDLQKNEFFTHPLGLTEDYLSLVLTDFSLHWNSPSGSSNYNLQNSSHRDALAWIKVVSNKPEFKSSYQYRFHYALPYAISDDFIFTATAEDLLRESQMRTIAHNVISSVLKKHAMESEIRIWPHHFDTGALAVLPGKEQISIGLGLAIPDSLIDSHYFYISGYEGHKALDTSSFGKLNRGQWLNSGFKGAVIEANDYTEQQLVDFYDEAIQTFLK